MTPIPSRTHAQGYGGKSGEVYLITQSVKIAMTRSDSSSGTDVEASPRAQDPVVRMALGCSR